MKIEKMKQFKEDDDFAIMVAGITGILTVLWLLAIVMYQKFK